MDIFIQNIDVSYLPGSPRRLLTAKITLNYFNVSKLLQQAEYLENDEYISDDNGVGLLDDIVNPLIEIPFGSKVFETIKEEPSTMKQPLRSSSKYSK